MRLPPYLFTKEVNFDIPLMYKSRKKVNFVTPPQRKNQERKNKHIAALTVVTKALSTARDDDGVSHQLLTNGARELRRDLHFLGGLQARCLA